ncbi:GNAT family N-acetyltransferase [Flavisolibacter ginsenosidimutans]|uniref:GNAT family N-acetyltransferase n=1 Tax=Flavisolibacter ginsenosidimutans TaxID=661481 RepID=A0A5B8UFV3_9BACT|nr:GNAT family N-acetyltransferase [Flavisolibacter ginsenosidimutans]QEC55363.1 GNAT family N-acetyltransferase [Flavisolibacter ginsenosidimutans]
MDATILTTRLLLGEIAENDHAFILELLNTKGWLQFIGDRKVRTKEEAVQYIKKILAIGTIKYWVVRLRDTKAAIGIVSFLKRDYLEHFDLGFAFLPQYEGKGYAFEAAGEVLKRARENHPIVLATTIAENKKSIALLLKLGFVFKEQVVNGKDRLHVYTTQETSKL